MSGGKAGRRADPDRGRLSREPIEPEAASPFLDLLQPAEMTRRLQCPNPLESHSIAPDPEEPSGARSGSEHCRAPGRSGTRAASLGNRDGESQEEEDQDQQSDGFTSS